MYNYITMAFNRFSISEDVMCLLVWLFVCIICECVFARVIYSMYRLKMFYNIKNKTRFLFTEVSSEKERSVLR